MNKFYYIYMKNYQLAKTMRVVKHICMGVRKLDDKQIRRDQQK